jgi:hypothetical protein
VPVLGTVVDGEENGRGGQPVHEAVEHLLCLRIDPVQVLEHEQQRLDLALAQEQALGAVDGAAAAHGGIDREERVLCGHRVEEPQEGRDRILEVAIEREQRPCDPGPNGARVIAVVDAEIGAQEISQREEWARLAVGDRARLEHEPAVEVM